MPRRCKFCEKIFLSKDMSTINQCKSCHNKKVRERYHKNPTKQKQASRKWTKANSEKHKKYMRTYYIKNNKRIMKQNRIRARTQCTKKQFKREAKRICQINQ